MIARIALAVAVLALGTAAASPLPPRTVTGEETHGGGPYPLVADVVVASGGALRFQGTHVIGIVAPAITVRSGGTLEIGPGPQPPFGSPGAARIDGGGLTITIESGGTLRADGAFVSGTRLDVAGDATFTGATIDETMGSFTVSGGRTLLTGGSLANSAGTLVSVSSGTLEIDGASLTAAGGAAIEASPGSSVVVRDASIGPGLTDGIIAYGASVDVAGSTILGPASYGVTARHSTVQIRGNRFSGHCGLYLGEDTFGEVLANTFDVDARGLTIYQGGSLDVGGNTFTGADQALTVLGAEATITSNRFTGGRRGIEVNDAGPTITSNVFDGLEQAIDVLATTSTSQPVMRDNSFSAEGEFALRNQQATTTIDARWNYWSGEPNAPGAAVVLGPVSLAPWLTASP